MKSLSSIFPNSYAWRLLTSQRGEAGDLDPTQPDDSDEDLFSSAQGANTDDADSPEQPAETAAAEPTSAEATETPDEATEPAKVAAEEPAITETPANPAPAETPVLLAGRFKTQEDLIKSWEEGQSYIGKLASTVKRLEGLVEAAVKAPAKPATPEKPKTSLKELVAKAALDDADVDDNVLLGAIVERLLEHPQINTAMAQAISGHNEASTEKKRLRDTFYSAHEHLAEVPEWAMQRIAAQVQEEILATTDSATLTAESFTQMVLDRTAAEATRVFKLTPKTNTKPAPVAAKPAPASTVRKIASGVRSERGGARPAEAPALKGQDAEIAEIF